MTGACARPRPCASCPFRRDVPSGLWEAEEYERLPKYDGDMGEQAVADAFPVFMCHQADGSVCSGWLGYRDPTDLLAVRIGIGSGTLDPSVADYTTTVPLHPTARAAAEHGMREIDSPSPEALAVMAKMLKARELTTERTRLSDQEGNTP